MDVTICLPALYPLRYVVDHLEYRSPSTQSASLQAIKFFYDFWFIKHRTTFCYSFYFSGHDPAIAIHEMTDFFQYLENGRLVSFAPRALPFKHSSCMTNASRVRAVIRFIGYLIATYVSPYYRNETPKELSRYASRLNTRLLICKDEFKTLERSNQRYYSRVTQGFQSMTGDMVENVYRIVVPSSKHKNNFLNPFPSGFIQFRNYLIMRLMLNYGLRVGELLLLECVSVKASIKGDKFSLIISMPRNMTDPRIHAPSLKNEYSHRVLELDKVDYEFLMIYMQKIRKKSTTHNFIFASSQNPESPLSYNAVHLIFSEFGIYLLLMAGKVFAFSCNVDGGSSIGAGTTSVYVNLDPVIQPGQNLVVDLSQHISCWNDYGGWYDTDHINLVQGSAFAGSLQSYKGSLYWNNVTYPFPLTTNTNVLDIGDKTPMPLPLKLYITPVGAAGGVVIKAGEVIARIHMYKIATLGSGNPRNFTWNIISNNNVVMPTGGCTVDSRNVTVDLPDFPGSAEIPLGVYCSSEQKLSFYLSGATTDSSRQVFANTAPDATKASGVGVTLMRNGKILATGENVSLGTVNKSKVPLGLSATYGQTGNKVSAGTVQSVIGVTFIYE